MSGPLSEFPLQGAAVSYADRAIEDVGRLMKIGDVCASTGLSRATIYRLMKAKDRPFPKPIKIGEASRWVEREIRDWIRCAQERRDETGDRADR